ncbi:MAG TPA: preprotein translocase subunit SecY [Candidatus Krumholzibacteriaceae bacterium]|nr:preprotein translocase subunit SecY [Candidatus Krumholzibacteriaceae bacterium]
MAGRFLRAFKPISRFMPEIKTPERKVGFNEKVFWTLLALAIYLVMAEIPLYGIGATSGWDLSSLRIIFASNRGTLMELGIGPIVTAGIILQLLGGSGIIEMDMNDPEDRGLFTGASKFFSIVLTGIQASAYLIGGAYGQLAPTTSLVIFLELLSAGVIVMLLDEMVQKGWGFGSGISLFILAGVAQGILWDMFAPIPLGPISEGLGSLGIFLAIPQALLTGNSLIPLFIRQSVNSTTGALGTAYPGIVGFIATLLVFFIVIYAEGVRVELPISHADYRGFRSRYPIKLLYVSNLPVIFASALFANVYFFAQLSWSMNGAHDGPTGSWWDLLGVFTKSSSGQPQPVGGLVHYVLAPRSPLEVAADPVRAAVYVSILVAFCVVFSLTWLEVGGLGPSAVAKQLVDSGMHVPGYRRSSKPIEALLKRYITPVTILGGIIVGVIAGFADFFGVFGSGMGILLSVGIIYQYYQLLIQERAAEMFPAFRRVLGE